MSLLLPMSFFCRVRYEGTRIWVHGTENLFVNIDRFWWIFVSSMQQKTGSFISWNPSLWSGFLGHDHLGEHEVCVNFDKWKLVLQIDSEKRTKYLSTALDRFFFVFQWDFIKILRTFSKEMWQNWSKSSSSVPRQRMPGHALKERKLHNEEVTAWRLRSFLIGKFPGDVAWFFI